MRFLGCKACGAWNERDRVSCKNCGAEIGERRVDAHYVLREFPEHYNHSMGAFVKSRAHHRQLQKALKCHDWEACRNSPGSQLSLGRKR